MCHYFPMVADPPMCVAMAPSGLHALLVSRVCSHFPWCALLSLPQHTLLQPPRCCFRAVSRQASAITALLSSLAASKREFWRNPVSPRVTLLPTSGCGPPSNTHIPTASVHEAKHRWLEMQLVFNPLKNIAAKPVCTVPGGCG